MLLLSFVTVFKGIIFLIVALVLVSPYLCRKMPAIKRNKDVLLFFILVFVGSILNLINTHNGIGGTINFIVSISVALFCIENINYSRYFVLFLCLYTIYFIYNNVFVLSENIEKVFDDVGLSKNYPGFIMVACCCYWSSFKYVTNREMSIILPILCTVFAFFLDGRSSLGIMFMLSMYCLFIKFKQKIILFIMIIIVVLSFYMDDIMTYYSLTNLSESGMETARYKIWSAYIDNLDFTSFFFGLDTLCVPLLKNYGGNPHNAFLNFHYRMGILGLFGLLFIIYKSTIKLLKSKSYVLLVFLLFLLGRIFFDACIGSSTDYLIYSLILYPLINCNNTHKKKKLVKLEKYI